MEMTKPSNSTFLSSVANYIRMRQAEEVITCDTEA